MNEQTHRPGSEERKADLSFGVEVWVESLSSSRSRHRLDVGRRRVVAASMKRESVDEVGKCQLSERMSSMRLARKDSRHGEMDVEEEAPVCVGSVGGSDDESLQEEKKMGSVRGRRGERWKNERTKVEKLRTFITSTLDSSTRRKMDPSNPTGRFVVRTASSLAMARDRLGRFDPLRATISANSSKEEQSLS